MTIDALLPPPPIDATPAPPEGPRRYLRLTLEAWLAIGAFAILCIVVLATTPSMLEPDDYAYRASIIALSHGHIWLSASQYASLAHQLVLSDGGHSSGIVQWVHRANGTWISEKNPGYPFFAVPFFEVGLLRVAPLFYGGLASIALYIGGRRWLGRWGGTAAVAMFVSSGAAMIFAWRSTMPTFTDASMVAAGCGLLIWALLNDEATETRRTVVGLLAFLAFDAAVFIRYTNLVALGVAVAVTVLVWIFARRTMPTKRAAILLGSQALFAVLIASLNAWLYGGATSTGYSTGEITFSLGAFSGNLHVMPKPLIEAMPVIALALIALIWIVARFVVGRVTRSPRAGASGHRTGPRTRRVSFLRAVDSLEEPDGVRQRIRRQRRPRPRLPPPSAEFSRPRELSRSLEATWWRGWRCWRGRGGPVARNRSPGSPLTPSTRPTTVPGAFRP